MREKVLALLCALGVTEANTDSLLDSCLRAAAAAVTDATGQKTIPEGLEDAAVYHVAGQYLKMKKSVGTLSGFDLEGAVKQLQEGDTSVTYAVGEGDMTPEGRLDSLISWLMDYGAARYGRYRRLSW